MRAMQKKIAIPLIFIISFIFNSNLYCAQGVTADDLIYMTENFPPHNFIRNNTLEGASVEILELIWEKMGTSKSRKDIKIIPWARGIKRLKNEPNTVLFGMGYSRERSVNFHWVGPYYTHTLALISKKSNPIKINRIEDAKHFQIGVVREDIGHQTLLKNGFSPQKLDLAGDIDSLYRKLKYNRFDMICYVEHSFFNYLATKTSDHYAFKPIFRVANMKSGFGFNKNIPSELIKKFQHSLDELIDENKVNSILNKYKMK